MEVPKGNNKRCHKNVSEEKQILGFIWACKTMNVKFRRVPIRYGSKFLQIALSIIAFASGVRMAWKEETSSEHSIKALFWTSHNIFIRDTLLNFATVQWFPSLMLTFIIFLKLNTNRIIWKYNKVAVDVFRIIKESCYSL